MAGKVQPGTEFAPCINSIIGTVNCYMPPCTKIFLFNVISRHNKVKEAFLIVTWHKYSI